MNLISVINDELKIRNWSKKELSEKSSIPRSTLSIKLAQPKLNYNEIQLIANAFNIPVSELATRAEEAEERKAGK